MVLPFWWSRSGYWFCRLVGRFWIFVKKTLRYRVLSFVDDFALAPSSGRASTSALCVRASAKIDQLIVRYGLTRHPQKGFWGQGAQVITHLGFVIDTVRVRFGVPQKKLYAISDMAKNYCREREETGGWCGRKTWNRSWERRRVCAWLCRRPRSGCGPCTTPSPSVQALGPLLSFALLTRGERNRLDCLTRR